MEAKTKTVPAAIRLLPSAHAESWDRDYYMIELNLVVETAEDGIRNPLWEGYQTSPASQALADLEIRAQVHASEPDRPYGWSVEYRQPHSVDLARAEAMAKTLRKVARGLERAEEAEGTAQDFAQYAGRVVRALGETDPRPFMVPMAGEERASSYSDTLWRSLSVDGLRYWIAERLAEWKAGK